jgi:hypothetical protein
LSRAAFTPGPQGSQGAKGDRGDKGDAGTPATRLWARVNTGPTVPVLLDASGVASVVVDPGFGDPSIFLVTFDRDVSHCAFVGSRVGRGGGSTIPTPVVAVDTGFYVGSGMTFNQVRVSTYLSGTRTKLDFDIAAFC